MNKKQLYEPIVKDYYGLTVKSPEQTVQLEGVYQPPKSYSFLKRLKWHLWDQR